MEIMKWLEPSLVKRVEEVIDICEIENKEVISIFASTFSRIKQDAPEKLMESLFKIEELFTQRLLVVETAYRIGFNDGMFLTKI